LIIHPTNAHTYAHIHTYRPFLAELPSYSVLQATTTMTAQTQPTDFGIKYNVIVTDKQQTVCIIIIIKIVLMVQHTHTHTMIKK